MESRSQPVDRAVVSVTISLVVLPSPSSDTSTKLTTVSWAYEVPSIANQLAEVAADPRDGARAVIYLTRRGLNKTAK